MTKSVCLLLTLLMLGGCGDSNVFSGMSDNNTPEAKRDRGVAALGTGEWELAAHLLEDLYQSNPDDPDLKKYLASAYIGLAGFDTLDLFTEIAEAQESNTEGSILFYSVLGNFSDGDGSFGDLDTETVLTGKALDILAPADHLDGMTRDNKVQAGLYASVRTILIITSILEVESLQALDTLQDEEIERAVRDNFNNVKDDLEKSLTLVTVARDELIDAFADGRDRNDIAAEFDIFLEEIGFNDGELDEDDLIHYLQLTL